MTTLTIQDVGPIRSISLPCPEGGGIIVLRGRNGSGKTTALDAVDTLLRGKGSLSNRDGTSRGEIDGFGVRITVGRSTRRTGELECLSLEGRLSIDSLVDPGIADPEAADARRIKALVGLSGANASVESFVGLMGDRDVAAFEDLLKPDTLKASDPVDMAARVKRDLEAAARDYEATAEKQEGAVLGFRKAAEGIDLKAEADAEKLQAGLEAAIRAESAVKERARAELAASKAASEAQEALTRQRAAYSGPTVAEASGVLEESQVALDAAVARLADAERAVEAARRAHHEAKMRLSAATDALSGAKAYAALEESARQAVAAASAVTAPDQAEVQAAVDAVSQARRALENGAAIRRARQQLEAADEAAELAKDARRCAERLRDAARGTDDVLSQLVASPVLRVESGRLVTDTARGVTLYAELSMGERWRIALDLAADQVGEGGIIVVPQEAYESLDPQARQAIHGHAVQRRVTILTAEATDGELRAEVYGQSE